MFERIFRLSENNTTARREILAGATTFLTMAYIIVVQPMVLTGQLTGKPTGMDFGAVTTATCLAAFIATTIMALYARYPIAQAPGMGENFFFVLNLLPAAAGMIAVQVAAGKMAADSTTPWQIGLGVVFYSGIIFLLLSTLGVREKIMDALSPSLRNGVAAGIGLFIALLGLKMSGLIIAHGDSMTLNPAILSPDLIVFFCGLTITAALHARRVPGSIFIGIVVATLLALALRYGLPHCGDRIANAAIVKESALMTKFHVTGELTSAPPSIAPTLFKMDLVNSLSLPMIPYILIFLFMVLFDTLGTLVGIAEQAGFIKDDKLPRAKEALTSDAIGAATGAALGTSTVTSFIESAAGVEQGGRTGLTSLTTAVLMLAALFFAPIISMVGSYSPITSPALVIVGAMMLANVAKIDWKNYSECIPAFLVVVGVPMTGSIADGLALGFIFHPAIKLLAGQGREVKFIGYLMAAILLAYLIFVRMQLK